MEGAPRDQQFVGGARRTLSYEDPQGGELSFRQGRLNALICFHNLNCDRDAFKKNTEGLFYEERKS